MLYYWYGDYELLEDNHNYIQWYVLLPRYASTVYAVTVSVHPSVTSHCSIKTVNDVTTQTISQGHSPIAGLFNWKSLFNFCSS